MRAAGIAFVIAVGFAAGCASGEGGGGGSAGGSSARKSSGKSALDLTWGWGWNLTGGQGPYARQTASEKERSLAYYRSHVRTEDAAGNALKPVEQAKFVEKAVSNAPVEKPVQPASFVDIQGRPVRLEDYHGKKSLVLVFTRGFPGYLCPLCTSYTAQIAHRYPEIAAAGGEVLVVFPGSPEKVGEFVQAAKEILEQEGAGALPFPVLLDIDLKQVAAFGIQGDLAKPSTYVIDRAGKVRFAFVGEQSHERPDVDTILGELRRLEAAR